jgi:hypothetical protein
MHIYTYTYSYTYGTHVYAYTYIKHIYTYTYSYTYTYIKHILIYTYTDGDAETKYVVSEQVLTRKKQGRGSQGVGVEHTEYVVQRTPSPYQVCGRTRQH